MFKDSSTHGFLPKSIDRSVVARVNEYVELFLNKIPNPAYFSAIDEEIPLVRKLISPELEQKIKLILQCNSVKLFNVELHYLRPTPILSIPHHQDNFYHCEKGVGLKVLVPLTAYLVTVALSFLDCKSSIGVLEHSPSDIENFSSYIKPEIIDSLHLMETSYTYEQGDASYHLLNSIHFSRGNKTHNGKSFIVFRYQSLDANESPTLLANYAECYRKHSKLITQTSKV